MQRGKKKSKNRNCTTSCNTSCNRSCNISGGTGHNHSEGFTLIEIICALAVLTLVFMAFTVLVSTAAKVNLRAAESKRSFDQSVEFVVKEDKGVVETHQGNLEIRVTGGAGTPEVTIDRDVFIYISEMPINGKPPVHLERFRLTAPPG